MCWRVFHLLLTVVNDDGEMRNELVNTHVNGECTPLVSDYRTVLVELTSKKPLIKFNPVLPLFSGWNCVAHTFPF